MKISLFQGILLGVFGIGALLGLFVFATYTSTSSGTVGVGTVVIWGTLPSAEMQNMLTEANKQNTELKSVSYVEKNPATFDTDLESAIAAGNAPDMVIISQEDLLTLQKVLQKIPATELPASTFESAFAEEGSLFQTTDGSGTYGVPFLIDPLVMYDNRAILSSTGIAQAPSTWEAFTGLVPQVAQVNNGSVTRALAALGTYDNVHDARALLSALFLQVGAPLSTLSSNGLLTADLGNQVGTNGEAPGQAVVRFYTQFADPSKVSYTWNGALPDSQTAFLGGSLALYFGYASEAQFLSAANPNLDFEVKPLPQPATATTKATYGLVYAFAIPNGSKNAGGAYQAAVALVSSAIDQIAAQETGLAPSLLSLLATPPQDPTAAVAYASALYAKGWLSPAPADTDAVFSGMISSVTSGSLSLQAALGDAEASLAAFLQK